MSTIRVQERHDLTPTDARERLGDFEQTLAKWGVKLVWRGDKATIKGTGVSGDVVVSSSAVDVKVKLGLIAKAAGVDGERLKSSLQRRLTAAFVEKAEE